MIVQESHVDGVTIKLHDDYYKDLNDEAIQKILHRIAARAQTDLAFSVTNAMQRQRDY